MFKNIVRNLSFSPSSITNLDDYDVSLRKELKLRIIGITLTLTLLLVQAIVVIFPPISTSLYSPNDLLNGINNSASQIYDDCINNDESYQDILRAYGISCVDIINSQNLNLRLNAFSNQLYSLNRISYDPSIEKAISISNQQFYIRQFSYANHLNNAYEPVIKLGLGSKLFFISVNSGNLISYKEDLVLNKSQPTCSLNNADSCFVNSISVRDQTKHISNIDKYVVSPNDVLIYTLSSQNKSTFNIKRYIMSVSLNNALVYANLLNSYGGYVKNGHITYTIDNISPGQTRTEQISLEIKHQIPGESIPIADKNYANLNINVVFGNSTNIQVSGSFNKFYEIDVNNKLPSTDSRTSLIILLLILTFMLYFLLRVIVIRDEIKKIKLNQSNSHERHIHEQK